MDFRELQKGNQRLIILRALERDLGYSANESIINNILVGFGHTCSRDCVRTHLAWLHEQGLLAVKDVSGYMVATITQRGADVACGRAVVPGVDRPSPRCC
ncbi:MAG: ArsR family transcriptional regulator [Pseudomonadota bacterium]